MPYWCPYCGEPIDEVEFIKAWRYHSPKGGLYFTAKIYQCTRCGRKFRIVEKAPGIPLEIEKRLRKKRR